MLNPEERNRARKKAMRLLEHMDRTEKGLTDKLRQAEFSQEAMGSHSVVPPFRQGRRITSAQEFETSLGNN